MNREDAISIIDDLFPADAPCINTAGIGKELLGLAKINAWKNESDAILFEYARLCIAEKYQRARNGIRVGEVINER